MRFSVSGVGFSLGRRRKELLPETSSLSSAPLRNISRKISDLRQVVVQVGQAGILRDGLFEDGDGLVVFQVVEMVEPLVDQGLLSAQRRGRSGRGARQTCASTLNCKTGDRRNVFRLVRLGELENVPSVPVVVPRAQRACSATSGSADAASFSSGARNFSCRGVAHGDRDVAQKARVAGARHGECRGTWRGIPSSLMAASSSRGGAKWRGAKAGSSGHGRAPVPGADVLADVAAEDVRADSGAVLLGNRAAQLDGEVGDAAGVASSALRRGRSPRSDRRRCSACRCRSGRAAARPARSRATPAVRPGRTTSPAAWLIRQVFLPIQPSPARRA